MLNVQSEVQVCRGVSVSSRASGRTRRCVQRQTSAAEMPGKPWDQTRPDHAGGSGLGPTGTADSRLRHFRREVLMLKAGPGHGFPAPPGSVCQQQGQGARRALNTSSTAGTCDGLGQWQGAGQTPSLRVPCPRSGGQGFRPRTFKHSTT